MRRWMRLAKLETCIHNFKKESKYEILKIPFQKGLGYLPILDNQKDSKFLKNRR